MSEMMRSQRQQQTFQHLTRWLLGLVWLAGLWLGGLGQMPAAAQATSHIEEVQVHLGNANNALVFEPDSLTFMVGHKYRLRLDNPSQQKHYFTAKDFADSIWTQKVEAGSVEVKGAIHELELKPQAEAEWVFVPMKAGTFELHCSIPGHRAAGMVGQIHITDAS